MTAEHDDVVRVALRAPEYWPRITLLALALQADEVLLADTFQYSRQSYQNRTRLRTPQGWQWLSVPLQGRQHGRPISRVLLDDQVPWQGKHLRSIQHNYGTAPFFDHYISRISEVIDRPWNTLGDLTCATTALLLSVYGISTSARRISEWPEPAFTVREAAPRLAGKQVLVLPDTASYDCGFLDPCSEVQFHEAPRRQTFAGFLPGMSALDLLFNYGPEARNMILQATRVAPCSGRG